MFKTLKASLWPAAWLGWQIESNWTDPFAFLAFSVAKPVTGVLILVFMYWAVAGVGTDAPIYAFIFLGNTFYIYVGAVMAGASYAILDDRERYRTLKYIYISPINLPLYQVGRAVARFITGTLAVIITLAVGALFFKLPLSLAQANWGLFSVTMALGMTALAALGVTIGMWTLSIRSEPWFVGEGFAAAFYLFSGAIYPVDLLPVWLQPVAYALPITYWLELVRRALLGPASLAAFPTFQSWSDSALLLTLGGITVVLIGVATLTFRYFDHLARERGMIDVTSNY
jgi:ABC-2 type transport system permease protein